MQARKWFLAAAIFTEVTGIVLVVGALVPGLLDPLVALVFAGPVVVDAPARLAVGIAGAVMAGWAATLVMLARSIDTLSARVLGTATATGVGIWFVLDAAASIATGAALNLVGNTLFLVILIVPALMLRTAGGLASGSAARQSGPKASRVSS